MKNNFGVLALTIISAAILSGCVAYGRAYMPAPPPPQVEVITVVPFSGAVWVPGYWSWQRRHREYAWVPGYWKGRDYGHRYEHRR